MTTLIFIENVLGSGQVVKLTEDFGDYSVRRELKPGENARVVVSAFKSLSVEEVPVSRFSRLMAANEARDPEAQLPPPAYARRAG